MLQKLSYFNLILGIIYVLVYLKSGTFNSTAGILMIIVFNWLCLRSFQLDEYKWKGWHYLTAIWSLYYIGTLLYGAFHILNAAITFDFVSNDTLIFLIMSFGLSIAVLTHLVIYFLKNFKPIKSY